MSAFVVSNRTIGNALCLMLWGSQHPNPAIRRDLDTPEEAAELGAKIHRLNCEAVAQRYGREPEPSPDAIPFELATPIEAYKSLACIVYQCTEGDIPERPLYKSLATILHRWASAIVATLPEYQAANWNA